MNGKPWTIGEAGILNSLYPTAPYDHLSAKLPGRTINSMHRKATRLKVKRRRANNWLTDIVLDMSDIDKGFVAGMLEGEGTINIYQQNTRNHASIPQIYWTNTDLSLLGTIQKMLKGKGSIRNHSISALSVKPCYRLILTNYDDMRQVLESVEPYLVGKKQKAQAVLGLLNEKAESLYERRTAN